MNTLSQLMTVLVFFLLSASCAVNNRGNPEIFQVGELEIRLYQDREKMARDLPAFLTLVQATRVGDKQFAILGYFDRQNKRIYAIDDARVVIHEFKHYLEPEWRHAVGATHQEIQRAESR